MSGAGLGFRRRDHNNSEAIAEILHPNEGYREKLQRRGVTPKDYISENKRRVKQMQAKNREQRAKEAASRHEPFKLSRFKNVRPRVSNQEEARDIPADGGQEQQQEPTQEPTQSGRPGDEMRRLRRKFERMHVKAPVPSLRELEERDAALAKLKQKEQVDFVNSNAWEVIKKSPPKPADGEDSRQRARHSSFGRIPRYLLERKEQWAQEEEERRRDAPDPDCPPGMVLLDEDERLRTLQVLARSLEEARLRMNRLPLRVETLSQVRRKNELEAKLREIEDAIKVFDRSKVYVAKPPSIHEVEDGGISDKERRQSASKRSTTGLRPRRHSTASSVTSRISAAA